jgi:hypothetical protein
MEDAVDQQGVEKNQSLMERARMLVGISESLELPLSGSNDPVLEACIARVKEESQSSSVA